MRYSFQQEPDPASGRTPWPVLVADGELIHGRPDATGIVGFSPDRDSMDQATSMTLARHVVRPGDLLGQYPIFQDAGRFFTDRRPIREAHEWQGDEEGLRRLREANADLRASLERSGVVASTWTVVGTNIDGYPHTIAAFRGELEPDLNMECWVEHVQSLNGPEAHAAAIDARNLAELGDEL